MTKYSTGSSGEDPDPNDEGANCSLCGDSDNLTTGTVAGAEVVLCKDCAGENSTDNEPDRDQGNQQDDVTSSNSANSDQDQSTGGYTITNPDSSWVEEKRPNYGNADTPYLHTDYSSVIDDVMNETDVTVEDISESTGVEKDRVQAVVDGRAVTEDIGANEIEAIERYLDIEIVDQR